MQTSRIKRAATWTLWMWSAVCLAGLTHALAQRIAVLHAASENDAREMAQIRVAVAAAEWLGVWAVVAVPAGIVRLTASEKE